MSNPEEYACRTCGYKWKHGRDGSHSCRTNLISKMGEVKSLLTELRGAMRAGCVTTPEGKLLLAKVDKIIAKVER